jgi:hypothetical protein
MRRKALACRYGNGSGGDKCRRVFRVVGSVRLSLLVLRFAAILFRHGIVEALVFLQERAIPLFHLIVYLFELAQQAERTDRYVQRD